MDLAVVVDDWSRRVRRWSIADHIRAELVADAMFDWIETWYNPRRRHSCNRGVSPIDYETAHAA